MPHSRAAELVDEYIATLDGPQSTELQRRARGLAARAELQHPINRQPSTIAVAAIYTAGLLCNEKLTQVELSEQCDKSTQSIRDCHDEMIRCEGIVQPDNQPDHTLSWWRRFLRRTIR